nr:unnamed protein product [Callosobruchus chinensis]
MTIGARVWRERGGQNRLATAIGVATYRDLDPSDFFLFNDLERMIVEKQFRTNDEINAQPETHFEAKEKSWYQQIEYPLEHPPRTGQ